MTLIAAIPVSAHVFMPLVDSAIRALALSGVAGLGLIAFRVKTPTARLVTWTAVLYAALAMPMLEWIVPAVRIPTPVILQYQSEQPHSSATENLLVARSNITAPALSRELTRQAASSPLTHQKTNTIPAIELRPAGPSSDLSSLSSVLSSVQWNAVAAGIYLAVATLLLLRFLVGLAFGSRLIRTADEIEEVRLRLKLAACAGAAGISSLPRFLESDFVSVPLTMGVLRPAILLPASWREWDEAKLDVVMAHELSHVARRDALTQRLSLLHRAIFWFSPLAWWLDRSLADLAEQASDEAALNCGADRIGYARTLMGFFEALQTAPGRVWWQGVSMAKAGQAEKRLERILSWKGSATMRFKRSIAIAVLTLAVPVVYLAASVHSTKAQNQSPPPAKQSTSAAPAQSDATPAPAPTPDATPDPTDAPPPSGAPSAAPVGGNPPTVGAPVHGPVAPMAPRSPQPPAADGSRRSNFSHGRGFSYSYGYDDEQRFVIVSGKTDSFTMSGTGEDARHVEKLRKQIPGDFIWFQRDEKSYIIRDQATIDRARKLWAPQEELGKKQEALGKQQEELGKQQEELGKRMEEIHVNVPDMTAELDKLRAELKQLNSNATVEQVGQIQSEIGELQSKIGEIQSQAGDRQGKLGEEMGSLGEKQGKLGEEQGELGNQQAKLAQEASRQMKQLLDDAIAKGIAQLEL